MKILLILITVQTGYVGDVMQFETVEVESMKMCESLGKKWNRTLQTMSVKSTYRCLKGVK
jgi:hypothetical protein